MPDFIKINPEIKLTSATIKWEAHYLNKYDESETKRLKDLEID